MLGYPQVWYMQRRLPLPAPKTLALLAYLALHPEGIDREDLAGLLWEQGKAQNVRQALYHLRSVPGSDVWLSAGAVVRADVSTDVAQLETSLSSGDRQGALSLWSSEQDATLLRDLDVAGAPNFTEWLHVERERLHGLHLHTLQEHLSHCEMLGQGQAALSAARELVHLEPLTEAFHREIIRLEASNGAFDAALTAFETCRTLFRQELQAEPSSETLALLAYVEQSRAPRGKQAVLARSVSELPSGPDVLYGRMAVLNQADQLLLTQGRILIQGLGGIGKTALALALAIKQVSASSPVLWLDVGDDPPDIVLDALAQPLGARRELTRGTAPMRAQALQRAILDNKVGAVVLDDVWSAYTLSRVQEAVPTQVPLIITSRRRYSGLPRLTLERLERSASIELLAHHAPAINARHPRADALCALLGDHPYALRLAGITMQRHQLDPLQLFDQLRGAPHDLGGEEGIRSLLDLSLERISDAAYEAFFGVGALFVPHCSPELLALALRRDAEATEQALYELVECGLAVREALQGQDVAAFRVHDLAWSYGQEKRLLRSSAVLEAALAYVEDHLNDPAGLEVNLSNILGALQYAGTQQRDAFVVQLALALTQRSTYLNAQGASVVVRELVEEAIKAAERLDDAAAVHDLWVVLGNVRRNLSGDLEGAYAAYHWALQYARSAADPRRQAMTLSTMGRLRSAKQPIEAERLLAEATPLAEESGDQGCLSLVLEGRGFLAGQQAQWEAASGFFQGALDALDRLGGGALLSPELDRRRFFALLNLGEAQLTLGHVEKGLSTKRTALAFAQTQAYTQYEGHAEFDLGQTLHQLGYTVEARQALHNALAVYSRLPSLAPITEVKAFMTTEGYLLAMM
ncbi:BTAD domain-containing putative transcriptional regulator [Deinococcus rubellus]